MVGSGGFVGSAPGEAIAHCQIAQVAPANEGFARKH
jgi:hypothetical protein